MSFSSLHRTLPIVSSIQPSLRRALSSGGYQSGIRVINDFLPIDARKALKDNLSRIDELASARLWRGGFAHGVRSINTELEDAGNRFIQAKAVQNWTRRVIFFEEKQQFPSSVRAELMDEVYTLPDVCFLSKGDPLAWSLALNVSKLEKKALHRSTFEFVKKNPLFSRALTLIYSLEETGALYYEKKGEPSVIRVSHFLPNSLTIIGEEKCRPQYIEYSRPPLFGSDRSVVSLGLVLQCDTNRGRDLVSDFPNEKVLGLIFGDTPYSRFTAAEKKEVDEYQEKILQYGWHVLPNTFLTEDQKEMKREARKQEKEAGEIFPESYRKRDSQGFK